MGRALLNLKEVPLDETVTKYLETRKESTGIAYEKCLKRFVVFYEGPFKNYIQEIEEERKANLEREVFEKVRPGEDTLRRFVEWHKDIGYSNFSTLQSLGAVQNILKFYGITISYAFIETPPARPMKENLKHPWRIEHLKEFVEIAEYVRDKAFIMLAFQSGLSIGDICGLNYGDIANELEAERLPLIIHTYREKTGVELKTCIGYDAVRYLRLYLESRPNIQRKDPLFMMLGNSEERMTVKSMQARFRKYVRNVSFLDSAKQEGYNPARPHSLRSGFRSRLTGKVDGDLIEFLMGHDIGKEKATYINMPIPDFRQLYADLEKHLCITKTSHEELAGLGKPKISETAFNDLAKQVAGLTAENAKIRAELDETRRKQDEILQIMKNAVENGG